MTTEAQLLAAIADDPSDDARLIYADWLIANNDARGHLIVLDHADRTGKLADPEGMTQLLWLAAEHGFPQLPDPDAHTLAWERVDRGRAAYEYMTAMAGSEYAATFRATRYDVRHRGSGLVEVSIAGAPPLRFRSITRARLADEEVNVILSLASHAIRAGKVHELFFPETPEAMRAHPDYRLGPYPRYTSPEIVDDFGRPDWTLAARDFKRWYALWDRLVGPQQHDV